MGLSAIFSKRRKLFKNRVSSTTLSSPEIIRRSLIMSHQQGCLCNECKKEREEQMKQTCCALLPLIGLLTLIGFVSA